MYLAYLDESGNTGRKLDDPHQPVHWLIGLLVPEEQAMPLMLALDQVIVRHVPDDPKRELHGAELFGGDKNWRGVVPATRLAVYEGALATLAAHECVITHASINKPRLQRWSMHASPHLIALHFLMEKIDAFVKHQPDQLRQRALLVADETSEHEAFSIDLLADLQRGNSGVFAGPSVTNIVDTVHFVRSETNRGVQAADLIAYALGRLGNGRWESSKRGDQALASMVRQHVHPLTRTYRQEWPAK